MLPSDARLALAATRFTDVRRTAETGSTNREVAALAGPGGAEGVVVVADHQTAGRGRRGRSWDAPPGSSLLASVLLRPGTGRAHLAGMAAGLAAVAACAEVAGVAACLKWPNDVVVATGKLGGVLAEAVGGGGDPAVVVGLGLNVAWDAPLPPGGVDLRGLSGRTVERDALLVAYLVALEHRCGQAPGRLLADYRDRCSTIGRPVRVDLAAEVVTGTALAVDDDGRLVVESGGARRTVSAGDVVHLR